MGNSSYCPWIAAIFNFFKISYFYEKYAELSILSGNETNYQEFEKTETITNFFLIIFNWHKEKKTKFKPLFLGCFEKQGMMYLYSSYLGSKKVSNGFSSD